jgi:hypothetical protein
VSWRNILDISAAPSGIKCEWYVCMYENCLKLGHRFGKQ